MSICIVYKYYTGIAILHPSEDDLQKYGIDAIAQKDVPEGMPYKIIESSDLPADRTFRAAWSVDEADLTDGVGAEHNTFDEVQA